MEALKFENLPNAVAELIQGQSELKALLLQKVEPQQESDNPLSSIDVATLTGLKVATLYGYCQRKEIPYHKRGIRLRFFKAEIINWIKIGRVKTNAEIEADAEEYLSNKKSAAL